MPKPGKSAASKTPDAKYGQTMAGSKIAASTRGGGPPKLKAGGGSGLIRNAKTGK